MPGGDDLHVDTDRIPDLAGPDHLFELHQRREEQVVLKHAEDSPGAAGSSDHPITLFETPGDRFLHLDMESGVKDPNRDFAVGRSGYEDVDDIGVDLEELIECGRCQCIGEDGRPTVEASLPCITQADDLDGGMVEIGRNRQFRDLSEPDNGQPDRPPSDRKGRRSGHDRSLAYSPDRDEHQTDESKTEAAQLHA